MLAAASSSALPALSSAASNMGKYIKIDENTWTNVREESSKRLAGLRTWSEFFDRTRMVKPTDFKAFQKRWAFNVDYFQNNYLLVLFVVIAYFLITNLWLFISVVFIVGGYKLISGLSANEPTHLPVVGPISQTQMWVGYGVVSFLMFFFSGVTSSLFYVAFVCGSLVSVHAGSMEKPLEADFEETV